MNAGIGTYTFPWAIGVAGFPPARPMDPYLLIDKAAEWKIRKVQIGDNLPLHSFSEKELDHLFQYACQHSIQLEVGTRGLFRDHILNYLSISRQLSAPFLRVVIDDDQYHPGAQEIIKVIRDLLPHIKEVAVPLALENHDRFPAILLRDIISSTDPEWVGVCLDTANSLGCGESISEIVEQLAPFTLNLHVKDFTVSRVATKMGFVIEGAAAGKGTLDIPWLINELDSFNKCKTATLEIWSNFSNTLNETINRESIMAEESINYLKTYTKN